MRAPPFRRSPVAGRGSTAETAEVTLWRRSYWRVSTPVVRNSVIGPSDAPGCQKAINSRVGLNRMRAPEQGALGPEKQCTRCNEWFPADLDHFGAFKQGQFGLQAMCRPCRREHRTRYYKPPEVRKPRLHIKSDRPFRIQGVNKRLVELVNRVAPEGWVENLFVAYRITDLTNDKKYIGITERGLRTRWRQHLDSAIRGKGGILHDAMREHGLENFFFEHIASAVSHKDLDALERLLIEQEGTVRNGYNQTRGGYAGESKGNEILINGVAYISWAAAARAHGVAEYAFHQRVNQYKWSVEQALGLEDPPVKQRHTSAGLTVNGIDYPNLQAAAEAYGLTDSLVRFSVQERLVRRAGIQPCRSARSAKIDFPRDHRGESFIPVHNGCG